MVYGFWGGGDDYVSCQPYGKILFKPNQMYRYTQTCLVFNFMWIDNNMTMIFWTSFLSFYLPAFFFCIYRFPLSRITVSMFPFPYHFKLLTAAIPFSIIPTPATALYWFLHLLHTMQPEDLEPGTKDEKEWVMLVFSGSDLHHSIWSFIVSSMYLKSSGFHFSLQPNIALGTYPTFHYPFFSWRTLKVSPFPTYSE